MLYILVPFLLHPFHFRLRDHRIEIVVALPITRIPELVVLPDVATDHRSRHTRPRGRHRDNEGRRSGERVRTGASVAATRSCIVSESVTTGPRGGVVTREVT